MKYRNLTRLGNAALVFGIVTSTAAGALLIATAPASSSSAAADTTSTSAVSIAWADTHTDEQDPNYATFKNIVLKVSQTQNLVNQGITIDWSGARTTSTGDYSTDFMQIMQCWGDDPSGPSPEQCQWGAPSATIGGLTGEYVSQRTLVAGADPAQDPSLTGPSADPDLLLDPPIESPNQRAFSVPVKAVDGTLAKSPTEISKLFDASTTNEVTAARTGGDGTGTVDFETQTALEAPNLGCGGDDKDADGAVTPRSCWLVVVPRGELNLDGSLHSTNSSGRITGSPLSTSAWKNRMVVKLGFQSVSQSCPLGNAEQRIVGAENISTAITSWQPALCQLGTTYGYSLIGDSEARSQITSDIDGSARLGIVTDPLTKAEAGDSTIDYAPVAESAIVIAYTIDYKLTPQAANFDENGLQYKNLTLDARLVAKLLTQSYLNDVPGRGASEPGLNGNPTSILTDPEFLQLNPDFTDATTDVNPAGLMVALGSSDANSLVWSWLRADPLAQSFLSGDADDWGMKINPNYLPLNLATDTTVDSFPKADLTIAKSGVEGEPGYGTLDMRPYMNDMNEAAYRTLKSDPNNKSSWDPLKLPPAYVAVGPQIPGARFILSITDAASAAKYGLTTAKLVNGAGQPTAPTPATINKGVSLMVDAADAAGVKVPDTSKRAVGAYPLAMLSYAAINLCESTKAELKDYAKLIDYATGAGQVSGEALGSLPPGYVPLSTDSILQAQATSAHITDKAAVAKDCPSATPVPTATPTPTKSAPTTVVTAPPVVVTPPTPVQTTSTPTPVVTPITDPDTQTAVQKTTDQPLSGGRVGLAGALALGIPSMIAGPLLSRRGRKLSLMEEDES